MIRVESHVIGMWFTLSGPIVKLIPCSPSPSQDREQLVRFVGLFLSSSGRFADAEPLLQRALAISEKTHGPEHPQAARSLNNLAEIYKGQGLYEKAESFGRKSLAIWEKDPNKHCLEIARCLNNLAEIYRALGRYSESESLHQQAEIAEKDFYSKIPFQFSPAGREKALSSMSPSKREELYNWELHFCQTRVELQEKALGLEHPYVAEGLNNLARMHEAHGDYAEARHLYQRALGIWEKAFGPEHLDTMTCRENVKRLAACT